MALWKSPIRLTLLLTLMLCAGSRAADDTAANIEAQIAQLSSDDWKARQSAMEKLVALGDDALPRLNRLANSAGDSEVRTRAAAAINQIEENRLVGMTLVTLNLHDVPPAQALAELAKQARGPLFTDPANLLLQKNLKPVSLVADHQPLWKMLRSLAAQCDLEVTGITQRNREIGLGLVRGNADWQDKPIVLSGPLLIRADQLLRVSTARLRSHDVIQEFNIAFTVFAEPKLKVMDYSGTVKLQEVVDDKGNSLIPPGGDVTPNVETFGNQREGGTTSRWEIGATLHYPKGVGTKITRFRGTTTVEVRTRSATLDIPLSQAHNLKRTVGGLRMVVKSADTSRCDLTIFRDGRNDADWYGVRMQISAGEAVLQDDKGRVVARSQNGVEADDSPDGQRMETRLRFARDLFDDGTKESKKPAFSEASRLVWEFPTEVRELSVPFEFRDLPIP